MMIAVAVVALGLGGVLWSERLQQRADYYKFVARSYDLEARNHGIYVRFYRELAEGRRRGSGRGRRYEKALLFTNDYGGRLTTARQEEWWSEVDTYPPDPDPERESARLEALAVQERRRADYFALLAVKYRRATARPWESVEPDPPPPP